MKVLLLRLEGPLQSWGYNNKWDFRSCGDFPTKSGLVGLLSCCIGKRRGDASIPMLSDSISFAARADRAGRILTEFQTIIPRGRLLRADGSSSSGTILSPRGYLQDASFLVAIGGNDQTLGKLAHAVTHPVWPPYLGRKCCIPSRPIFDRIAEYSSLKEAMLNEPLCPRPDADEVFPYIIEAADGGRHKYDAPLNTDPLNRKFKMAFYEEGFARMEVCDVQEQA